MMYSAAATSGFSSLGNWDAVINQNVDDKQKNSPGQVKYKILRSFLGSKRSLRQRNAVLNELIKKFHDTHGGNLYVKRNKGLLGDIVRYYIATEDDIFTAIETTISNRDDYVKLGKNNRSQPFFWSLHEVAEAMGQKILELRDSELSEQKLGECAALENCIHGILQKNHAGKFANITTEEQMREYWKDCQTVYRLYNKLLQLDPEEIIENLRSYKNLSIQVDGVKAIEECVPRVIRSISEYGSNEIVCIHGCHTIMELCKINDEIVDLFVKKGAVKAIGKAIKTFPSEEKIHLYGCGAMSRLCQKNGFKNSRCIADACDPVLKSLQYVVGKDASNDVSNPMEVSSKDISDGLQRCGPDPFNDVMDWTADTYRYAVIASHALSCLKHFAKDHKERREDLYEKATKLVLMAVNQYRESPEGGNIYKCACIFLTTCIGCAEQQDLPLIMEVIVAALVFHHDDLKTQEILKKLSSKQRYIETIQNSKEITSHLLELRKAIPDVMEKLRLSAG